jgi:putative tRNA adenosine deaminase-associated protein
VSYFTAVLARAAGAWSPRALDVDEAADLTDLTERLRLVEEGDEPVLLLLEREDDWWAIVRVDGDEDPRVFVSDAGGAQRSPYAGLLEPVADSDDGWGGDLDVLADLGTSPEGLRILVEEALVPMDAMATLAEAAGFAEVLDSMR